jgi:hypothetical protein
MVLGPGVDRDGADSEDGGAFIEAVAADDAAVQFGHDAEEGWVREEGGKDGDAYFGRWEVAGEAVDGVEG